MLESVELRGERFPWRIAFFLYVSSYGLVVFFLRACFWDDWFVNYQMSATEAKTYWETQLGFFLLNRFIEVDFFIEIPLLFTY